MTPLFGGCRLQCMGYRLGVKICGVTDEVDALQAAELGADWIGLNFYEGSPRYITPEKAESIMHGLPAAVEPVGIFILGELRSHLDFIPKFHLRTIQLHEEAEALARDLIEARTSPRLLLAKPLHISVITAFCVAETNDLLKITAYLKKCRQARGDLPGSDGPSLAAWMKKPRQKPILPTAILVDARVPGQFGGTGKTVPWDLLADFKPEVPLILAGGLTPENVAEAVHIVRPYAVDVASGVESSPGHKDAEKMKRFIENAREAADRLQ